MTGKSRVDKDRDPQIAVKGRKHLQLRCILSFLQEMEHGEELRTVPGWKAHPLGGDRQGVWSLTVTRNWRLTFRIDGAEGEIVDLDYEDYH